MPETLYLIDGYAQIFRAYYAIRGGMRSPVTGEPSHAVFGFTGMLLKLFDVFHPHYVVVALDAPGKTFRDELYAEYKGTRNATPDDLTSQIPRIIELIELFGIPSIGYPGMEADDVIGCIVHKVLSDPACSDVNIRIVSKDKDLEQLLGPRVTMFDIHTDTTIDTDALFANKGIRPEQVIDVLALIGDSVDNVPGVDGIGPKTASQLVHQFGSIDGILAHLDEIPGKKRESLERAAAHLPLSRELVTLKCDVEMPFTLDAARVRPLNAPKIITLFQQLGFNRFQDEVRRIAGGTTGDTGDTGNTENGIRKTESDNGESVIRQPSTVQTAESGRYEAVVTREQLARLVETLRKQPIIAVDTETTGLHRTSALCGLSFAWEPGHGVYVPTSSPDPTGHLDEMTVLGALKPVLEDPAIPKCGHNFKFDAQVLLRYGIKLRGASFDTMLASALSDPGQSAQKLDFLAENLLNYRMIPIKDLIGDDEQVSIEAVPLDKVTVYAAEDADITLRLYHVLTPKLREMGLEKLLREVESPLAVVLADMEMTGILCDPEELLRQGDELKHRVEELKLAVLEAAGVDFAIDSPKLLAEVLFDRLKLPSGKKTKTGYSTDIEVLEKLASQEDRGNPRTAVPRLIIEYRQLAKLISTYLGNLRGAIRPESGRIHSTFHQLVTATGRLASHNPNLQNIPVRSDVGRQIRKAFKACPGESLICADYSQVELRILAHCSGDEALIEAFEQGQDIHTAVAAQVFGVEPEQVTREQRNNAKTINFGIIYGVTPFGLARRIEGLDIPAATKLIADYKARFPGIDRFLHQCVQRALEDGFVTTLMGRRRYIPEITAPNRSHRALGERLAINSVIQGSAADLIKIAMVRVHERIDRDKLPMRLLLHIHDELVLESPADCAESNARIVCDEMEGAMKLRIPLVAECGVGPDWLSAK